MFLIATINWVWLFQFRIKFWEGNSEGEIDILTCFNPITEINQWSLIVVSRDCWLVLFSSGHNPNYKSIAEHCNLWRNYDDIYDSWDSVLGIINFYGDDKVGERQDKKKIQFCCFRTDSGSSQVPGTGMTLTCSSSAIMGSHWTRCVLCPVMMRACAGIKAN